MFVLHRVVTVSHDASIKGFMTELEILQFGGLKFESRFGGRDLLSMQSTP